MNYQKELNQNQYEAVSSAEQYLRIIAGAGSGKTRVLTYRIAYLIDVFKVRPYEILAITFTNKVAKEMQERTASLLPDFNLSGLTISTFHSFCARFLRIEAEYLGIPRNYTIYDDDDSLRLIKMIGVDKGYKKTDDINTQAYKYISFKKMQGLLPSQVKLTTHSNPREKIFLDYFKEYERRKSESGALDFDDLLIYTIKILRDYPEVRAKYTQRIRHILVDEFQDTNDVQFELLKLLTDHTTCIYVVGDPDQTIYTWRGANQGIILNIDRVFSPMKTIILNENYRSTTKILEASNKLISFNKERVKKDLFTNNSGGDDITLKSLDSSIAEANFVANTILELKNSDKNFAYKNVAILYRSSYLSLKIENAFTTRGIPYRVYGGLKFYARKEIKDALAYFHLLFNDKDDVSFLRICNFPRRGFGDKSIEKLTQEASSNGLALFEYVRKIKLYNSSIKSSILKEMEELVEKMDSTRQKLNLNLEAYSEVLDQFLKNINFYKALEDSEEDDDKLENVHALIDDIRNYLKEHPDSNFEEYLQNITLMTSQDEIKGDDNVSLMTVHTAKGLEFDYVFVIGLNDGVFPNQRAIQERDKEGLEEERRLAYVAFTRAKKRLYVTSNRDYSYASQSTNVPSRFIKEAGLKMPSFTYMGMEFSGGNSGNLYYYNSKKNVEGNGLFVKSTKPARDFTEINIGNGIKWNVNDRCNHNIFGKGTVTRVDGDIIDVTFDDFGNKKLLGSHKALSKIED